MKFRDILIWALVSFYWKTETYKKQLIEEVYDYAIVVVREGNTKHLVLNIPIGAGHYPISPRLIIPKGSQVRFLPVSDKYNYPIENLVSLTNLNRCSIPPFAFDPYPLNEVHSLEPGHYYFVSSNKTLCENGMKFYIVVEDH